MKFPKIRRFGSDEVEGILQGTVYVQEKVDGANCSFYINEEGTLSIASRNRELQRGDKCLIGNDFRGLMAYTKFHKEIEAMCRKYPEGIFYGEWCVYHTLKYHEGVTEQVWFYDIYSTADHKFCDNKIACKIFEEEGVKFIPIIATLENPKIEDLDQFMHVNQFQAHPDQEGIVIKNPEFVNRYGRTQWAKRLNEAFHEKKVEVWGEDAHKLDTEEKICYNYVTLGRIKKILNKIEDEGKSIAVERTGELLGRVYNDIVTEEIWDILKKYKNPTIDFKKLNNLIVNETKRIFFNILEGRDINLKPEVDNAT